MTKEFLCAHLRAPQVFDTAIGWRLVTPAMACGTGQMAPAAQTLAADPAIIRADRDGYAPRHNARFDADWHGAEILSVPAGNATRGDDVTAADRPLSGGPDHDGIKRNKAFAAQGPACTRARGLANVAAHVNACSGGIAMGHPLDAPAARSLVQRGGSRALPALRLGSRRRFARRMEAV